MANPINFEDYFPASDTTYPFVKHAPIFDTINFKSNVTFQGLTSGINVGVFNVKNYGAKGDGVTDDTAAIQSAINAAIAAGGGTVYLPVGHYMVNTFLNTTNRAALTIDSGFAVTAARPIIVNIVGAVPVNCNVLNGSNIPVSYPSGGTVIDGSRLDVLQYGLYKQGRIFLVTPQPTSPNPPTGSIAPLNAIQLRVSNMTIILPAYSPSGSGVNYTIGGSSQKLFLAGDSQASNQLHSLFVNGVDAWCASQCSIESVDCVSAIAGLSQVGNQFAGADNLQSQGSAAAFIYPGNAGQGNNIASELSTYDVPISLVCAAHVSCNQLFCENGRIAIYTTEGGHGSIFTRTNVQATTTVVQHQLLSRLTTVFTGFTPYDPRGDLFAPAGLTFPSAASTCSLIIEDASIEAQFNFLVDDPSNPLTLIANVEVTGGIGAPSRWQGGANCMVNFIDVGTNARQVLNGTTVGTVTYSQSGATPWDKHFVAYLSGYENTTGTAQTITFVNPYNVAPAVVKDATAASTVSATTLTLPASMGSPVTGYIILEGY